MTDDAKTPSTPEGNLQGVTQGSDLTKAMIFTSPKVTAQTAEQAQGHPDTETKAMIFTSPKVTAQNAPQLQAQPETPKKE